MSRLLVIAVLVVAACHKSDPGPTCDQVVDHMLDVTKQVMLGHNAMTKDIRKQLVDQCVARNLPKDARECMMAAKDPTSLSACYRRPGMEGPHPLPPSALRRPNFPPGLIHAGSGAAAGSGSGSAAAVGSAAGSATGSGSGSGSGSK